MKIGERGQVTIPKEIRYKYGLLPNTEVEFVPQESGVVLRKISKRSDPIDNVYGMLGKNAKTDDVIEAMRGR